MLQPLSQLELRVIVQLLQVLLLLVVKVEILIHQLFQDMAEIVEQEVQVVFGRHQQDRLLEQMVVVVEALGKDHLQLVVVEQIM